MSDQPFSTFRKPRKALAPFSAKRLAQHRDRVACVKAVRERDRTCQFWRFVPKSFEFPPCGGPLDVHEPQMRSHGADPTNPDECVLLCRDHHDWCHQNPDAAEHVGLLVRHPFTHVRVLEEMHARASLYDQDRAEMRTW